MPESAFDVFKEAAIVSEYQYYEFQALDRPLDEEDRKALRTLSSRARITATSLTNSYEWGNFKGSPDELMARWFDLHLYLANWGSRRLMIRFPKRLIDASALKPFLRDANGARLKPAGENLVLDVEREEMEPSEDWDDGSGWLAALAPLRADVLGGDPRLFYLLWLKAVEDGAVEAAATAPLPGIGPMTGALEGFARFFGIDPDLVAAAAERCGDAPIDVAPAADAVRRIVANLPDEEKTDSLVRLLAHRVSITMEAAFCVEALEEALARHGKPEIFNTDQGSQFTSIEFTSVLTTAGVSISMDGKGAWLDNVFVERLWRSVKYEEVYLKAYDSVSEARASIGRYLTFYHQGRPHSSLDGRTPDEAYFNRLALAAAA